MRHWRLEKSLNDALVEVQKFQASSFKQALFSFKDSISGSTITGQRKMIANELQAEIKRFKEDIDAVPTRETLDALVTRLEELQTRNSTLSRTHTADSGRLQRTIDNFLTEVRGIRSELPEELSDTQVTAMKGMF